jgi:membrane glycosyltransferase
MLPEQGTTPLEVVILALFTVLLAWVSSGFWTSVAGFFILIRGTDRFAITRSLSEGQSEVTALSKTALIMPIANENVARVFKGLETIYRSIEDTGHLDYFEFFVLSDSNDPDKWVEEEVAWAELCRRVDGFDRIHYRMRRSSIKRKSGNVAEFCRRWGANYVHMIVLDADSIMSGETIVRMVRMMDDNPQVGIIQTAPLSVNRESLFARIKQFANRVYGTMFAAGLHYWQLGEAQYWGHNAIIRVGPFMAHCGLPRLPGEGALGGEIMSHDFVEAALMRRAGWSVWLAYDLYGSYEEPVTTLADDLKRDRRWCHGNLQHSKLLFAKGIHQVHRTLFLMGILAYVSAPLWFMLLLLSSFEAILQAATPITYFGVHPTLFPEWPVSYQLWAISLFIFTMCLLFLPKILALALSFRDHQFVRQCGGGLRLLLSVFLESLSSVLLAPVRMVVHSRFVVVTLFGKRSQWGAQQRGDFEFGWRSAWSVHGMDTLIGLVWGGIVYLLAPGFFWWLTPIIAGLVLSIPLSVYASRKTMGRSTRRWGLFLIPEETRSLPLLDNLNSEEGEQTSQGGFVQAVVDPFVNALHLRLLKRESGYSRRPWVEREQLVRKASDRGLDSLTDREKNGLLSDAQALAQLHLQLGGEGKQSS